MNKNTLLGTIEILHIRNGRVVDKRRTRNKITNAGLALAAARVGGVSADAMTYLELGTGTTAATATDTTLETAITDSGLARASATVSRVTTTATNDTLQLSYTWTATASKSVTEEGMLNAATNGTMLARQVFAAIAVVSGDQLRVTHKIAFSEA